MIEEKHLIEYTVDSKILKEAEKRAKDLGKLKNSITGGAGNVAGFVGEICVRKYLGARSSKNDDTYNNDLVYKQKKIEVKTKRRSVAPKLDYEASVAKTSLHQKPDYYIFTSLEYEDKTLITPKTLWIIGYISYSDFIKNGEFMGKGKIDQTNGFKVLANMINLYHFLLNPMEEMNIELSN